MHQENHSSTPSGSIMGAKEGQSASSTSAIHGSRKRKGKTPLVETEVRRSCRLKALQKGYKKRVCVDKHCLSCHALPPLIPGIVIKNLNSSFCKVNVQEERGMQQKGEGKKLKGASTVSAPTANSQAKSNTKST